MASCQSLTRSDITFSLLVAVGIAFTIFSLLTEGWVINSCTVNGKKCSCDIGVRSFTASCGNVTSMGSVGDLGSSYSDGGNAAIACGALGLLSVFVASVLFFVALCKGGSPHLKNIAIILTFVCGIFLLIGVVIYAKKQSIDYSFVLFNFATYFFITAGIALLLDTPLKTFRTLIPERCAYACGCIEGGRAAVVVGSDRYESHLTAEENGADDPKREGLINSEM